MGMSELLSLCEKRTNFREIDFLCFTFTYLAVLVTATFNDFFDVSIVKILVIASLIILYLSIKY